MTIADLNRSSTPSPDDALQEEQQDTLQDQSAPFEWTKQWYPLAVTNYLDPSRPHAVQLLGKDLVLWRDGGGTWRCFEDACPHRLAPLSEGRVEDDGTLLCAYHAWRFDGNGQCDRIPQSKDAATEAKHRQNPKACAIAYPTQEQQGLLWVWGEPGDAGRQSAQQREPRLIPELDDDSGRVIKGAWNFRDLPYGWDFFIENVADPAHVTVAHHGLVGKREDATYYDMPRVREMSTQEGFAYDVTPVPDTIVRSGHDFQPPCLMRISSEFKDGGQLILVLYAVPTRPGWCRHIGRQVLIKNDAGKVPSGLAFFSLPMPIWLSHILASLFLHQDLVFLHYQQEKTVAQRKKRWLEEVYTPNPQDKMIIAFRQWLDKRAGAIPWVTEAALPPAERDKQQLFDVWHTHTKHCHICQKALTRMSWARRGAYSLALVCFGMALMVDARAIALHVVSQAASGVVSGWAMPPLGFWGAIFLAILFAAIGYGLKRLKQLFYVYEFEHADND